MPDGLTYYNRFVDKYVTRENEVITEWDLIEKVNSTIKRLERLKDEGKLDEEQKALLERLTGLVESAGDTLFLTYDEAYIKAYCLLKGYKTALLLWDGGDTTWWHVVFDLDEETVKEVEREIESYVSTIEKAEGLASGEDKEFMESCMVFGDEGASVEKCLAKAKEILARA